MRAIVFDGPDRPLRAETRALPEPAEGRLLLKVKTCGVCRTDLHLLDGEVAVKRPPRILCHQIVATVIGAGPSTELEGIATGQRVGVPWLGWTCGQCEWCRSGRENLCPHARFTGCDIDGGMAEYTVADARYCFAIPENYPDDQAAPLLCAGLIGWRSLRMCGEAQRLGLYGFGAAAHHRPGRRLAGAQRVRPDKTWRHRGSRVRPQARGGLGGRLGRTAA
jgi:propanol-preferring alcohol dehydrogenase